jgi:hypothetical protein
MNSPFPLINKNLGTAALCCPLEQRSALPAASEKFPLIRRPRCGLSATRLKKVLSLLLSALREIFDESAYARFLKRHQLSTSRASYARFLRENELAKARRPRCC